MVRRPTVSRPEPKPRPRRSQDLAALTSDEQGKFWPRALVEVVGADLDQAQVAIEQGGSPSDMERQRCSLQRIPWSLSSRPRWCCAGPVPIRGPYAARCAGSRSCSTSSGSGRDHEQVNASEWLRNARGATCGTAIARGSVRERQVRMRHSSVPSAAYVPPSSALAMLRDINGDSGPGPRGTDQPALMAGGDIRSSTI